MSFAVRKPSESLAGTPVKAYLNLHLPGRLSIIAKSGAQKGKVVGHPLALVLKDCRFVVSEAGRQRVLKERCKNVHAGVHGDVVTAAFEPHELESFEAEFARAASAGALLRYNPYQTPLFCERESGAFVKEAGLVVLIGARVVAEGLTFSEGSGAEALVFDLRSGI